MRAGWSASGSPKRAGRHGCQIPENRAPRQHQARGCLMDILAGIPSEPGILQRPNLVRGA